MVTGARKYAGRGRKSLGLCHEKPNWCSMASPAAAGAATSGAKRSRGRPPKPEDEKKQARLWRCSVEPFTDADRGSVEAIVVCHESEITSTKSVL